MRRILGTKGIMIEVCLLCTVAFSTSSCNKAKSNSPLPDDVKIQINVPDSPVGDTRTKLITFDLQENRDAFLAFFMETKQSGMCSPTDIEKQENAYEVMTVTFWGSARMDRKSFYILKNNEGQWITTGFGGVEVYDAPQGFPCYRYSSKSIQALQQWYEKHIPKEYKTMK